MEKTIKKSHLIGVKELQDIVKLVVVSGFLKNHKPLSLLLVAKVGHGKTDIISTFSCKNVHFLSDLSSTGVYDLLDEHKQLTHIVLPDFTKITMKNKATSNNLMTTLNSAIEEGLGIVRLKNTKKDFKGKHIGLITATTDKSYNQNKKKFSSFGFSSRFLIASFSYSDATVLNIMESIYRCEYLQKQYAKAPLKKENGHPLAKESVEIPYELAKKLNRKGDNAFRTQKQMQTLACCNALINNRKVVTEEDLEAVLKVIKFCNMEYTEI